MFPTFPEDASTVYMDRSIMIPLLSLLFYFSSMNESKERVRIIASSLVFGVMTYFSVAVIFLGIVIINRDGVSTSQFHLYMALPGLVTVTLSILVYLVLYARNKAQKK